MQTSKNLPVMIHCLHCQGLFEAYLPIKNLTCSSCEGQRKAPEGRRSYLLENVDLQVKVRKFVTWGRFKKETTIYLGPSRADAESAILQDSLTPP